MWLKTLRRIYFLEWRTFDFLWIQSTLLVAKRKGFKYIVKDVVFVCLEWAQLLKESEQVWQQQYDTLVKFTYRVKALCFCMHLFLNWNNISHIWPLLYSPYSARPLLIFRSSAFCHPISVLLGDRKHCHRSTPKTRLKQLW